jgi:beta-glucosidase
MCAAFCAPCLPPASSITPASAALSIPSPDLRSRAKIEEGGIVLLKNKAACAAARSVRLHSIAVIGSHSDVGMISGGGSAQVDPPGGNAISKPGQGATHWQEEIWFPTSPLKAIQARAPKATSSTTPAPIRPQRPRWPRSADVAIVFAYQWESEGMDLKTLSLHHNQDALIAAVAAANPHTIVVLETGSPSPCPGSMRPPRSSKPGTPAATAPTRSATFSSASVNPSAASCPTPSPRAKPTCPTPPSSSRRPSSRHF